MRFRGLVEGNRVIYRTDEEIAASVNVTLPGLLKVLQTYESTLTAGHGYIKPLSESQIQEFTETVARIRKAFNL